VDVFMPLGAAPLRNLHRIPRGNRAYPPARGNELPAPRTIAPRPDERKPAMARFVPPAVQESIQPNVVPLLDVMFLLLIFLMIGSDMSVRDTAELTLPKASSAQEEPAVRQGRYHTLNVRHVDGVACSLHESSRTCRDESHWTYTMLGDDFGTDVLPARLAVVAADETEPAEGPGRALSAVTIGIRCDRTAPYGLVQTALGSCAEVGIHRTEIVAALPTKP
jgi:biopolymer transport protein ExbD